MIRLYNSLSKSVEDFRPIEPGKVSIYACGPTVYDYITIGNFRTFALGDFAARILEFNNFKVKYIMNLTDVGHLSGDNEGDADTGQDKLEKAAEKEGQSAREIADFYIKHFLDHYEKLNLQKPHKFTRATEYIQEQIDLIKQLEKKGYTYKTSDGVYYDTSKYINYGQLSGLTPDKILEGARVEPNPEKRNPNDFALWKFSPENSSRWQEWDSPWGTGFPGWHIECSAMSMKELGETIDIHVGGEDLKMIHHQNEIAQSEACTGKKFVNYWLHGAFLQIDGGRMGKSLGNAYTVADVVSKGFDPLALRYFYMTAHYRSSLNFTWNALQSADVSLKKLYSMVSELQDTDGTTPDPAFTNNFIQSITDDFNMPKALSVVWEMLKSNLSDNVKLATILKFDQVLGLNIENYVGMEIPQKVLDLVKTREMYRKNNIWDKADLVRKEIDQLGYTVEDAAEGSKVRRKL